MTIASKAKQSLFTLARAKGSSNPKFAVEAAVAKNTVSKKLANKRTR